MRSSFCYWVC